MPGIGMREKPIFLATNAESIARAEFKGDQWMVTESQHGTWVNCLVNDPHNPETVFAGTQTKGVLVSKDTGKTWQSIGLKDTPIKSLAVHPHDSLIIYAGGSPVSLYITKDAGMSWEELPEMRKTRRWWWFSPANPPSLAPYVQALTISPANPKVIMAGIELGGVLRSEDGGITWSGHRRGAVVDCHSMIHHHSNGDWVYEGGGGGAAYSQDGGLTWNKPKAGLKKKYGWVVAADPAQPEVWYISASGMPNPLRGEFTPPAHNDGNAKASIYRSVGGAPWEQLAGGLPEPLDYMAYALLTDSQASGHLYAGLANGDVWQTLDYGNTWQQLPFNLGGIQRTMVMI